VLSAASTFPRPAACVLGMIVELGMGVMVR
jgi:hypothetical protein